jgi:hypothetical protein
MFHASERAGFCGLSARHRHVLATFVSRQPPRVVAEAFLEVAGDRLTVTQALDLLERWQNGLSREALHVSGGDTFPSSGPRGVP